MLNPSPKKEPTEPAAGKAPKQKSDSGSSNNEMVVYIPHIVKYPQKYDSSKRMAEYGGGDYNDPPSMKLQEPIIQVRSNSKRKKKD